MLEKNKIVDLLCEELSYAYCDNCRYVMGEDDACDNCHRKYSGWSLSEDTANYIANAIVAQGKVVEQQNDSPDIQPKTGRWIPIKPLLTAARCSECKRAFTDRTIFCPNCGAQIVINKTSILNKNRKERITMKTIKIKYHNKNIEKIEKIDVGDWIDLRAAETLTLHAGESALISLGVAMKLPEGYEAQVAPRSSTFKKWGIIQTNSIGIIDNSYSGTNDIWRFPAYAVVDTVIQENDRICQFRIVQKQPAVRFEEVDELDDTDRGGFGSTGAN